MTLSKSLELSPEFSVQCQAACGSWKEIHGQPVNLITEDSGHYQRVSGHSERTVGIAIRV